VSKQLPLEQPQPTDPVDEKVEEIVRDFDDLQRWRQERQARWDREAPRQRRSLLPR